MTDSDFHASPLPRQRRTRIVATLGPASSDRAMIEKLFRAGADVFRLNFSHGTHDDHRARLGIIRELEKDVGHPIGIIADLQGPKLRVGKFANKAIDLRAGMVFSMDLDETPGNEARVCLPHPEIIAVAHPDMMLLVDDGKVQLRVREQHKDRLVVEVVSGARLSDNKGVNVPGVILPIPALTEKDRRDLVAALDMGADYIAQSFVQRPEDVAETRKLSGGHAKVMAKLEKPSAIERAEGIIELSDAIMLARGDLGVEIPPERVPPVQKHIVRRVRAAGKPVIVATQMLESMISAATPTRAEASDVATAIYDGTDAIMLSAETASGQYPVEAVAMMDRIARSVENDPYYRPIMDAEHPDIAGDDVSDAISASAHFIARDINAAAIATFTTSGFTARRAARQRPVAPILCLTPQIDVARRLTLSYGVHPVHDTSVKDFDGVVARACAIAREEGMAEKGQRIVITAGVPFGTPGSTNVIRIAWVD
ncbi:MAG: pyruvate kinase [Rhodospirillales bacterium]|nr:pyruvate kinase [Alphaproteobacteria bacterium]MCB9986558.1 pyruvate kinase [Rhodospirillales bacterium]USO06909.1 MAG: pyruvate kinase [Rhodospirillales bacterium]